MTNPQSTPAKLFIGPPAALSAYATEYVQKELCPQGGCQVCSTCYGIRAQQHHTVMWLAPETRYALEDIEPIMSTIGFALEPGQKFFFIIQKADFLSEACSNKLLKSIEEPPAGYHFLFLAERLSEILPTIRSRCTLHTINAPQEETAHATLFDMFAADAGVSPLLFWKTLEGAKINEHESIELLDSLLSYWSKKYSHAVVESNHQAAHTADAKLAVFKRAYTMPPMPGSSKLFWRDIFLQLS